MEVSYIWFLPGWQIWAGFLHMLASHLQRFAPVPLGVCTESWHRLRRECCLGEMLRTVHLLGRSAGSASPAAPKETSWWNLWYKLVGSVSLWYSVLSSACCSCNCSLASSCAVYDSVLWIIERNGTLWQHPIQLEKPGSQWPTEEITGLSWCWAVQPWGGSDTVSVKCLAYPF